MEIKSLFIVIMFLICSCYISTINGGDDFYIPDGETDIVFDEEFDGIFGEMPIVEIALSSFVFWNFFSVCLGMCICGCIQTGYYKFQNEMDAK